MTTTQRRTTLTEIRHGSLRHHLSDTEAVLPATDTSGLSIVEVAGGLEVHPTTYWRIERGQGPLSEPVVASVAAVRGVTVELVVAAYSRVRAAGR